VGTVQIRVCFFARGRDLAGCAEAVESMPPGSCVKELLEKAAGGFPAPHILLVIVRAVG
jgi:molybdopterin converting factor small subunit